MADYKIHDLSNPDDVNRYISAKVEKLAQKRVEEEIRKKQQELRVQQDEILERQARLSEKQTALEKKEIEIEKQAAQVNKKIKIEIEKHEKDLELKQKELERKHLEVEKLVSQKVLQKEKEFEEKTKELHKAAVEAERKLQAEIEKREKELSEKKKLKDERIPEIINKSKEEVKKAQRDLLETQRDLMRKQGELIRRQKKLAEKEAKLRAESSELIQVEETNAFSKKRHPVVEDDSQGWLITYSDVVTLLLTFFVFMFTVSKLDHKAVEEMRQAINIGFLKKSGDDIISKGSRSISAFNSMKRLMQNLFNENQMGNAVEINLTDNGIKLELSSAALYDLGSAEIKEEITPVLTQLSKMLQNMNLRDMEIDVEGHTDNIPINTPQFPSNWELSASRATNIVKFLILDGIDPTIIRASGFADSRPKVPNTDEQGNSIPENQAQNRRVEIYIENAE